MKTFDTMLSHYDKYAALDAEKMEAKLTYDAAVRAYSDTHTATLDGEVLFFSHQKMMNAENRYQSLSDDAYAAREKFLEAALVFANDYRSQKEVVAKFFLAGNKTPSPTV